MAARHKMAGRVTQGGGGLPWQGTSHCQLALAAGRETVLNKFFFPYICKHLLLKLLNSGAILGH